MRAKYKLESDHKQRDHQEPIFLPANKRDLEKLLAEAEGGELRSQYLLALALEQGFAVAKDPFQAKTTMQAAAVRNARWAQTQAPNLGHVSPQSTPKSLVLLAEDNLTTRAMIRNILVKYANCEVIEVANGDLARKTIENEAQPDLIISDVHMPHTDGFRLAEYLRGHPVYSNIPLIFLSGDNTEATLARARSLGIKHWLLKTTPLNKVVETVQKALKKT